ncbi:hypothetical protein BH10PSE12_BH10PSE12_37380 [soil metagenome]
MRLTAQVECVDGQPVRLFGAKQDITAEKQQWDQWRQRAERDHLTGLGNRGLFHDRFHDAAGSGSGHPPVCALVLIDLDRFKQINDRFGHSAGDACLREFAIRLQAAFRDALLVARIGGDEFAVLLGTPYSHADLGSRLNRIARVINRPVQFQGRAIPIGASMGAAIVTRPQAHDPARLFAQADAVLYAVKAAGPASGRVFIDDMAMHAASRSGLSEPSRRYG